MQFSFVNAVKILLLINNVRISKSYRKIEFKLTTFLEQGLEPK